MLYNFRANNLSKCIFKIHSLLFCVKLNLSDLKLFLYVDKFINFCNVRLSFPPENSFRLRFCRESARRLQRRLHLRLGVGKWVSRQIPCRNLLFRRVTPKQPKNYGRIRLRARDDRLFVKSKLFTYHESYVCVCVRGLESPISQLLC